jgi:hypothetical protein
MGYWPVYMVTKCAFPYCNAFTILTPFYKTLIYTIYSFILYVLGPDIFRGYGEFHAALKCPYWPVYIW